MAKYEAFSRRELRALLRRWAWKNRIIIGLVGLGVVALIALTTVVFTAPGDPGATTWYVLGALHVALLAAFAGIVNSAFLVFEGQAVFSLRGEWGEEATRAQLVAARHNELIWGWVDSVSLENSDIDHLVVTREGGLVAIDSRWRTKSLLDDHVGMERDAANTRARAEQVFAAVVRAEAGGDRATNPPLKSHSVVVLWGPEQHELPTGFGLEGVDFVGGHRLVDWLRKLDGEPIAQDVAQDLVQRVEELRAREWESATDPD